MFGSARTAAGGLFSTAGSEHAHLYGSTLLVPGGRRGCTSGCWRPDVTLPVDVRDHRLGSGALCRHGPGTADRHHADRLWLDQPGDSGGSMPAALDELLLDGAQGAGRLESDGPCFLPHREAGGSIRALRRGRRRYPDPARVRGGTGRRDPVRSCPQAQSAGLYPGPAYVNELRPTLLTNVGSPWLQWRLITDAARPSQPARPFGAVQKAARRPCRVAKTLIMGQRLAWPGCV